jgi:hypothetical protein
VPNLLDQLREQRATARAERDQILTRAASEGRDPSPEELAQYQAHDLAEREASDALEAERDRQLAEVRAMATRRPRADPDPPGGRDRERVPVGHLQQEPGPDRGLRRADGG